MIVQAVDPPAPYPPTQTREQISVCQAGGLQVEAYVWLWFGLPFSDIQAKLALLDGTGVSRVWLDVEDTNAKSFSQRQRLDDVSAAIRAITGAGYQFAGIYTGAWFWQGYMQNTPHFSVYPLWDAKYDGVPDPSVFIPYGGWTSCAMKQYAGTSTVDGVGKVDQDEATQ